MHSADLRDIMTRNKKVTRSKSKKIKKSVLTGGRNDIIGNTLTQDFLYGKFWYLCSQNFSCNSRNEELKYTMMHFEALLFPDDLFTDL